MSVIQLKSVFRAANLGSSADDRRGLLNEIEFGNAVQRLIATVKDRMSEGETRMASDHPRLQKVQGLLNLDAGTISRPRVRPQTAIIVPRKAGSTQAYNRHSHQAEERYSNVSILTSSLREDQVKERWRF